MKALQISLFTLTFCLVCNIGLAQNVAVNFDGSNDYIQTNNPGVSGLNDRTVEAMIRTTANCDPNNRGVQNVIVDWGTNSAGERFTLNVLYGNAIRVEVSGYGLSGQTVVNDGKWHHVAATYTMIAKQGFINLYVDGVLDTSATVAASVNTGSSVNIRIGQRIDGVNSFDGDIDEVRVFDRIRSQSEIKDDMRKEYCKYPKGLIGYYKLNEGNAGSTNSSKKTAKDYSASKKDGTLTNFALSGSTSNWVTGDTLSGGDTKSQIDTFECYSYTAPDGKVYTSPGAYTTVMTNASGCDSTITLNLTLGRAYLVTRHAVCDSFVTRLGKVYYKTGWYRDTLVGVTSKGCDSILIMEVVVHEKIETQEELTVCDSVKINSKTYYDNSIITMDGKAVTGCDSSHTIDLVVNKWSTNTLYEEHCDRFRSSLGNTYTKTGVYKEKLSKANKYKCDSLIIIDLIIHPVHHISIPIQDCDSFISPAGNHYLTSGVHTERYTTPFGCDSIIAYDVGLSLTKRVSKDVDACDSILVNGIWRTSSEVIEFKDMTTMGCDSFVKIDLQVTNIDNNVIVSGSTLGADQLADSYQWIDCKTDKAINGEKSMSFTPNYTGSFAVDLGLNNCTKRSDCYDVIGLSAEDLIADASVLLFPNPAHGSFTLGSKVGTTISKYKIVDVNGRILQVQANLNQELVPVLFTAQSGLYFVEVELENKRVTKVLVIQ